MRVSLFVFVLVVCSSSLASPSECNQGSVSIQAVDGIGGGQSKSIAEISNPLFQAFVSSVVEGIGQQDWMTSDCNAGRGNARNLDLLFVRVSLGARVPDEYFRDPLGTSSLKNCSLYSPWVDIEIDRADVRGVIRWSQRQLVIDQMLMAEGAEGADVRDTIISDFTFDKYAQEYARLEILSDSGIPSDSAIPPDMLWLFRSSWQSTRGPFPFAARSSMGRLMERSAEEYSALIQRLFDHCASSGQVNIRYRSVHDLKGVMTLDEYKVDNLR